MNNQQPKPRSSEFDVLLKISSAMAQQQDLHALMNEILRVLESDLGMIRTTLTLRRPDSDEFVIEASRGLSKEEQQRGIYRLGEGITGEVARTKRPLLIPDIRKDPRFLDRTGTRRGAAFAFLCVPIIHHNRAIGTLSADRPSDDGSSIERDLNFLVVLSNIIAEAVARFREQIEEKEAMQAENRRLRLELDERYKPANMVGNSSAMRMVYEKILQVAEANATVLIRGETGTGKELVARAIHCASARRSGPFVALNCAAIPEHLVESELFGHEKGAFTGAHKQRTGRFETASGGTIFLDEIGDVSPNVQVRLLRVLQERTFERVGGSRSITANARIIAATSRNLEQLISEGRFREDLYYRLNVFPIHIPPLRERRSDILVLADHFLEKYGRMYGKPVKRISTAAINMMMTYHWPGNVRELENLMERLVLTCTDGVIHGYALPPSLQSDAQTNTSTIPTEGASLKALVASYEKEIITDALKKQKGNIAAAARLLQTTPRILGYKIKQLGIDPERYRA